MKRELILAQQKTDLAGARQRSHGLKELKLFEILLLDVEERDPTLLPKHTHTLPSPVRVRLFGLNVF